MNGPRTNTATSTSIAEGDRKRRKAANNLGQPIKFPSKLLALCFGDGLDETEQTVYIAGADGQVYGLSLSTNEVQRIGRPSAAPLTCLLALVGETSPETNLNMGAVYAGGWNKYITSFPLGQAGTYRLDNWQQGSFKAHDDFVKCVVLARAADNTLVILSGGADGDLNIWKMDGTKLGSLRPQSRGVEYIAVDPLSTPEAPRIFFSTSQREIYHFILPGMSDMSRSIAFSEPIVQHETSVYKLVFDNDGDLWTASADKTAKRLVRDNGFVADTTLAHPDFVRDIVLYEPSSLAITACRDEEIRVWNTATSQLMHIFTGHFEEVTGLTVLGNTLLSVSIDATLRRWDLTPANLSKAIEVAKNPSLVEDEPEPKNDFAGLTAEEEAELQALMDEEEADSMEKMALDDQ